MNQYLLSTYATNGQVPGAPTTPEEARDFMERVIALEAEMEAEGVFVFGGSLDGPDASTAITPSDQSPRIGKGPLVESSSQIAGFYIINADDLDHALEWARKVVEALSHSIEVRPFRATGKAVDHLHQIPEA